MQVEGINQVYFLAERLIDYLHVKITTVQVCEYYIFVLIDEALSQVNQALLLVEADDLLTY